MRAKTCGYAGKMSTPQQPELQRSRHTSVDQAHAKETIQGARFPAEQTPRQHVPKQNRPGHHPEHEQDKPNPEGLQAS